MAPKSCSFTEGVTTGSSSSSPEAGVAMSALPLRRPPAATQEKLKMLKASRQEEKLYHAGLRPTLRASDGTDPGRCFLLKNKLTQGQYGTIFETEELVQDGNGCLQRSGDYYVIKEICKEFSERRLPILYKGKNVSHTDIQGADDVMDEIKAMHCMSQIDAPNVVKLLCVAEDTENICIVMPWIGLGLNQFIHKVSKQGQPLTIKNIKRLFLGICKGVAHIHLCHWCHLDISLENICVIDECEDIVSDADTAVPCIIDFGQARPQDVGTLLYPSGRAGREKSMAPEVYADRKRFDGQAADVWSLGMLLHELMTGSALLESPSHKDQSFVLLHTSGVQALLDQRGSKFPETAVTILSSTLATRATDRITVEALVDLVRTWVNDEQSDEEQIQLGKRPSQPVARNVANAFVSAAHCTLAVQRIKDQIMHNFLSEQVQTIAWASVYDNYKLQERGVHVVKRAITETRSVMPPFMPDSAVRLPSDDPGPSSPDGQVRSFGHIERSFCMVDDRRHNASASFTSADEIVKAKAATARSKFVPLATAVAKRLLEQRYYKELDDFLENIRPSTTVFEMARSRNQYRDASSTNPDSGLPALRTRWGIVYDPNSCRNFRIRTASFLSELFVLVNWLTSVLFLNEMIHYFNGPNWHMILTAIACSVFCAVQLFCLVSFGLWPLFCGNVNGHRTSAALMYLPVFSLLGSLLLGLSTICDQSEKKAKVRVITILGDDIPALIASASFVASYIFSWAAVGSATCSALAILYNVMRVISTLDSRVQGPARSPLLMDDDYP